MNLNKKNILIIVAVVLVLAISGGIFAYNYNLPENKLKRAMDLARNYVAADQFEEAKSELHKALEIDADNTEAYMLLAHVYIKEDNLSEAMKCYEAVIEIEDDNAEAYLAIGEEYYNEGNYDKALGIVNTGYDKTQNSDIKSLNDKINNKLDEIAAKEAEEERIRQEEEKARQEEEKIRKEQEEAEKFEDTRQAYIQQNGLGYNIGQMMPDCEIISVNGESAHLSDFLGKPLYINLFTTWCPYCDMEVGDMQATYDKYSEDIEYIMIDLGETAKEATQYSVDFNLSIPMYLRDDWTLGDFEVEGVPTTFVLDKYGRITSATTGMAEASWIQNATVKAIHESRDQ